MKVDFTVSTDDPNGVTVEAHVITEEGVQNIGHAYFWGSKADEVSTEEGWGHIEETMVKLGKEAVADA